MPLSSTFSADEKAVVGCAGYGEPKHFEMANDQCFQVNRFSYSSDLQNTIQCVTGFGMKFIFEMTYSL